MPIVSAAEHRFAWWHQGLFAYDESYDWSSTEIDEIDFTRWIGQDSSRAVTFVAPGAELFGSSDAPLRVELHDGEPPVEGEAETVADFDLDVPSGRLALQASGGGELTVIDVPAGSWRARWSGFGERAAVERAGPDGLLTASDRPDRYVLQLWPRRENAVLQIARDLQSRQ